MKDNAIYLEVDEDITSAIDKLGKSAAGPVQIVVPKRSAMLQSIINLKLLKKAADQTGKEIVLVTGDRIATELAARVGLSVAPSIGAPAVKAEAKIPEAFKSNEEVIDADEPDPLPVKAPETAKPKTSSFMRPLIKHLPVTDGPPPPAEVLADTVKRGPKVPNFGRLQRRLMWLGLAIFLVGGYILSMYLFTSAKVVLYASGTKVSIDTTFSADPALTISDPSKSLLAAQLVTVTKDLSAPFVPSGKKDVGTKAGGTMTVTNSNNKPYDFVAGTRFQAPDGKIFHSTSDIHIDAATATIVGSPPKAVIVPSKKDVAVIADSSGDSYNEGPATYSIPGLSSAEQQGINGQGAQMSGGTTKSVTVVTQADVDSAKVALLEKDKDNSQRDLAGHVPSGYIQLESSQATAVVASPSPAVDAEGDTGTLALKVTYTVLAVKKTEYEGLLHAQEQKQVGDTNQIYDDGLKSAQITSSGKDSAGRQTFHFTTEAYGGTKIDKQALAQKLKGARFGDATSTATGLPGVTRAEINIWPAWVSKMPSRPDKITITIQVATQK